MRRTSLALALCVVSTVLPTLWATAARADEPAPPGEEPAPPPSAPEPAPSPSSSPEPAPNPSSSPEPAPSPPPPVPEPAPRRADAIVAGRVFTHFRMPTSNPRNQPFQQVSASAWLDVHPRFNEATSARAVLTGDALGTSIDGTEGFRGRVREAYVTFAKNGWEARVGQQIIPWGNADGVNPTDVLGARDFGFFSADTEVRRIGAISAKGSWTPNDGDSPFTLTLVATPVFPSSRLIRPPGAIPPGVVLQDVDRPPLVPVNIETAARAALTGSGWDVALIGFRGFNHLPEIELVSTDASSTVLRQVHRRNIVAGLEASTSPGKWVVRLEAAYLWNRNASGKDASTQPSHAYGVLGVERPLGERLRVQLQGVTKYSPSFRPLSTVKDVDLRRAVIARQVAQVNAILLDYTERVRVAGTARIAFTSESELFEAEIFVLAHAIGGDGVVRPLVSIRPSDALRFSLGSETLWGPKTSPLGGLRRYSGAFFEARYMF